MFKKKYSPTLLLIISLLIISFTPIKIFSLFGLIGLLCLFWPKPLKASLFFNVLFYFFISTCLLIFSAAIIFLSGQRFTVPVAVAINILLIIGISKLLFNKTHKSPGKYQSIFEKDDFSSVIIAGGIVCFIVITTISGGAKSGILREVTTGFDNAQHNSLSLSIYQEQGLIYGNNETVNQKLVYKDRGEYPKGWHLINATWWRSLTSSLDSRETPIKAMLFFYITKMIWLFLTLLLFVRSILYTSRKISESKLTHSNTSYLVAFLLTTFTSVLYTVPIVRSGFGSFILIPIYMVLLFLLLNETFYKEENDYSRTELTLVVGSLIVTASAFTWLLSLPIFFLAYTAWILQTIPSVKLVIPFTNTHRKSLAISALIGSTALLQCYFQYRYAVKVDNINDTGGITPVSTLFVMIGSVLIVFFAVFKKQLTGLLWILFSSMICTGLVYIYQMLTIKETRYFFIKMLGTCLFIVLFGLCTIILFYIPSLLRRYSVFGVIIATVATLIFIPAVTSSDVLSIKYILGKQRPLTRVAADDIINLLEAKKITSGNFILFRERNYEEDLITTIYINMLGRQHNFCQQSYINDLLFSNKQDLFIKASECSTLKQVYFITDAQTAIKYRLDSILGPKVTLIVEN